VITSKDDYNKATPADDANGDFVPEIGANVTALHAALDDDFVGLGLTPCAVDTASLRRRRWWCPTRSRSTPPRTRASRTGVCSRTR
jgi:hypothetical protein